jgi:hypothetical protein
MRRLVAVTTIIVIHTTLAAAPGDSRAHWERVVVDGGAELLTLFSVLPGNAEGSNSEEIPILSVLRDTLGDDNPDNDRLRYVWLLIEEKPGKLMRWLSPEPDFGHMPRPLVDLSAPAHSAWKSAFRGIIQAMLLDPSGAGIRMSSRTYLSSQAASRTVRLFEALTVMQSLQESAEFGPLTPQGFSQVLARVLLAERAFGGLVRDTSLDRVAERELSARRQALAKNWELLRQCAEAEGLIFQPIAAEGEPPVAAMVWISRADIANNERRSFRSKFLGIGDPWSDNSVRDWDGYTETWHFDSEGRRTDDSAHAVRSEEMIPLSMYSLDHPKAPFLLIDFRTPWKPAFREAARRTFEEVPGTVLGVAAFTNIEVRGAQIAWNFIRGRQGAAIHRPSRLRAAASVRQIVSSAEPLEPVLREQVAKRLGGAAPSSLRRYGVLLTAARSSEGLERRIEEDRGRELARLLHPARTRWLTLATVVTGGLYKYRLQQSAKNLALLDRERRLASGIRILEAAFAASPRIDVGADLARIRRAARDLATVQSVNLSIQKRAGRLLAELPQRMGDDQLRQEFLALRNGAGHAGPATALDGGGND